MPGSTAEQASSTSTESPFLRGSLTIFPFSEKKKAFNNVFMHISGDARFMRASSSPQHADDFANCDVVIDLERVAIGGDDSDDEALSSDGSCSSEALKDKTIDVVGPCSGNDDRTLSIFGHVTVRDNDQSTESEPVWIRDPMTTRSSLRAASREERDAWLLLLRARVAPAEVWHSVCRTQAAKCGPQSTVQVRLFSQGSSTQISQREICEALVSKRSRWMQEHANAPGDHAQAYGEGTADDVSDAALLLPTSLMQVMELSTRVGASASKSEVSTQDDGTRALFSRMETWGKLTCAAVRDMVSAATAGDSAGSIRIVLDSLMGCWDSLLLAEKLRLKISSRGTISEWTKILIQEVEKTLNEHASRARLAQPVGLVPPPGRDGPHQASFRVDIPCSLAAAKEGSPQYDAILAELLKTNTTNDLQPVAVTSVSGEGGAGKTTTCVLALRDARVKIRFKDGVIGFEVGLDPEENDIVRKIANVVEDCQEVSIAQRIRSLTKIGEAAKEAQRFFRTRTILLYLDNVWPDNRCLENLMSIASGPGSCVLFSTRSAALAQGYTERVVDLGTLRLDVPEQRAAAAAIFYKHLGPQRNHRWCTEANVNEALSLSQGLPIAIATLAALIRNKLVRRVTSNLLGQVAGNLHSPPMGSAQNVVHIGLFAAMRESLEFLDRQHSATNEDDGGSRGLMTRRYASLHALDRSENRIDASVLSIVWDTSLEDAEATAGEFFIFGLVTLATPGATVSEENNGSPRSHTLTLHDLQVDYSAHVADSGQHGISVEEVHETAVRGMFEGDVDIDALTAKDFVSRCEELCQAGRASEDHRGWYVVSNLVRYLVGSLTPNNALRRWQTIRRLLSDARWLMLWQDVDGWLYVCNRYSALRDVLSGKEGVLEVVPDAEVEAIVEAGRVAQTIPVVSRSLHGEDDVKTAAVEMYFRLHATWWDRTEGISQAVLQHALQSLCVVAGQWWMRPMVACHKPPVRDRRLRRTFAASRSCVFGCALIGGNDYVVTVSEDGIVRVHDPIGTVIAQHEKHSRFVNGVCVGRPRRDTEYRVFSVDRKGTLMRWDVSLPTATGGLATAVEPVVVASTKTSVRAVACSDDASVVAAGGLDGAVYVWAFGGDDSQTAGVSKFEAREHTKWVTCLAVSSDGATVLSGSSDGTCRVWTVGDALRGGARLCSRAVLGDGSSILKVVDSCAFACEERVAVTGHLTGAVRFWSLADATLLGEVYLRSGGVWSLAAIGRAGDEVVAGTGDGTAHVVRVSDRAVTAQLGREDDDWVRSVNASRDDTRTVVCGHKSGQVKVWDARRSSDGGATDAGTRTRPQRPRHSGSVNTVSTSSCGRFVVSGCGDKTVRCWRADTGRELWTRDCRSSVNCVCVSADAAHVACGCDDGTVRVLEMASGAVVCEWKGNSPVRSVCMHELRDDLVWSGHKNGEIVAWSRDTSTPAHRIQGLHGNWVTALGVAAGGKYVYSQDYYGRTAQVEISDDRETSTTIVDESSYYTTRRGRGNVFAMQTAQGFRTGGYERKLSRVRHAYGDTVHELAATTEGESPILNVALRLPDGTETAITTPTFNSDIYVVDASFVAAADGSCSFAQVVCGLEDGSVCILRQPLIESNQHWHPAESLQ